MDHDSDLTDGKQVNNTTRHNTTRHDATQQKTQK